MAITKGPNGYVITWFRNTASGWDVRNLVANSDLHDLEVADLDGDGKLDLVARDQGATGDKLFFWRQASSLAAWSRSTIDLPEGGEGLLAVDLDRDGKPDIAIGKYWFENASTPGNIAFKRHTYHGGAPADAYVAAGEIDNDPYVDLVVAPAEPEGERGDVAWYEAPATTTDGWTKHVVEGGVESVHHFIEVADFDQDGTIDIATAST